MLRAVVAARRWWSELDVGGRRRLLIAALLLFCYGFFQQHPAWNEYSRYDLVQALVEQGTTRIDTYHDNTGDAAFYQGHWYSDKAPGSALVGVPVYLVLVASARLAGQDAPQEIQGVQALAFVESGVATMLLVLLLIHFLRPFVGEGWATGVGLAYGFGSIAFPFATMFFGHAASTAALFASFYVLHRWRSSRGRWGPPLAGLLAGLAVLIEIPTVIGVAVLGLYALWLDRRAALAFVLGGLPAAAAFATYNWVSFGSPLNIGYMNLLPGGFASGMSEGILGVGWPKLETAGDLLFGHRGLVRLAPWFLVVPAGLLAVRRREVRAEVVVCAAICALFLVYNAGYYLPFGGWTPGPRFLLPALPFAAVLVGLASPTLRFFTGALMVAAAAVFFVATVTMPNAPERFTDPLFELWLPSLAAGALADTAAWIRWGLDGLGGLAVFVVVAGFGGLAVALSFGREPVASRTAGRAAAVLVALGLAFSFPFPPLAPVPVGWAAQAGPSISVAEVGNTSAVVDGKREVELWARIENRGGALTAAGMQFTVWRADGTSLWSAWYGAVPVASQSRQSVSMTWQPEDSPPGTYAYGFTVKDPSSDAAYANVVASNRIVLGP
jgi:hypothetical protein